MSAYPPQPSGNLNLAVHLASDLTELNEYCTWFYHREGDGSDAADIDARELMGYVKQTIEVISRRPSMAGRSHQAGRV